MENVVVERTFEQPCGIETVAMMKEKSQWCFGEHRIRFLASYISSDRKRMICIYQAPDAESVRLVNRQLGFPFDRVWSASVLGSDPDKSLSI
jgi:hypothetical protein